MNIQSLSISVPAKCSNNCPFCISKANKTNVKFQNKGYYGRVIDRVKYSVNSGVNTAIITSRGEPLENLPVTMDILEILNNFINIELQTSGNFLTTETIEQLKLYGIKTISLSLSSLDSKKNAEIMKMPEYDIAEKIKLIQNYGLNVRLSLNYNRVGFPVISNFADAKKLFDEIKKLSPEQVVFRSLYAPENTKQFKWIKENSNLKDLVIISDFIQKKGNPIYRLPFGNMKYSYEGISVVIDNNCMGHDTEKIKYFIIRENGKLYTRWDDLGSLLF